MQQLENALDPVHATILHGRPVQGFPAAPEWMEMPDSMRIDIPKDDVDPKSRRIDGLRYVDTEQWQAMKAILALVDEALAQARKK